MGGIIETRTLKISDRIIKSQDIRRLFSDLENEFNRLDKITEADLDRILVDKKYNKYTEAEKVQEKKYLKQYISKSLKIKACDGSVYVGQSEEILASGGILDTKQISTIDFNFLDNNHKSSLSINLRHTTSDNWNEVTVQGIDSLWVNGIIQKIENFLDSIERQTTWFKNYSLLIAIFITVCIALVTSALILNFLILLNQIFPSESDSIKISIQSIRVMTFFMMLGISSYPAIKIFEKIKELWPTVELQTGQDYLQVNKQKRNKIWLIFSLIIIPTVLTILAELIEI